MKKNGLKSIEEKLLE